MLKVFATEAFVSKGYEGAPALRFSEKGDSVRFRIGMKVYDTRAENNMRWFNLSVKAFGSVCERVKKMQIKEGSRINLAGRLDEDVWEDSKTGEKRSTQVIILDELEYCFTGTGEKKPGDGQRAAAGSQALPASPQNGAGSSAAGSPQGAAGSSAAGDMPDGFTGFEGFNAFGGGGSFFDENT